MRCKRAVAFMAVWIFTSTVAFADEKIVLAYLPNLHGLPLYVALAEKMFEKEGLSVEAVRFENSNQIIDALISGRADAAPSGGASGAATLSNARFPDRMKVIGLQGSDEKQGAIDDALIVKIGSPIKRFSDLKGKKLGTLPGIQFRTMTRMVAKANGINPDTELELVEIALGLQVQAVVSGSVDAVFTVEPIGAIAAASHQVQIAEDNPCSKYIVDPFFAGAGLITTKFLTEHPVEAKKLIKVMDKAVDMVQSDFNGHRKYLVGYTAITPDTVQSVRPMFYVGSGSIDGVFLSKYQKAVDIFFTDGIVKGPLDVSKMMISK